MTTHNAIIYHCIVCGRVEHAELEAAQPQCCGRAMDKACFETASGGDAQDKAIGYSVANPSDMEANRKRR